MKPALWVATQKVCKTENLEAWTKMCTSDSKCCFIKEGGGQPILGEKNWSRQKRFAIKKKKVTLI